MTRSVQLCSAPHGHLRGIASESNYVYATVDPLCISSNLCLITFVVLSQALEFILKQKLPRMDSG